MVAGWFRNTKTTYSGNKTTTKTLILTDLVFLDTFVEILVLKVSDIGERIPERGCHIHVISVHASATARNTNDRNGRMPVLEILLRTIDYKK